MTDTIAPTARPVPGPHVPKPTTTGSAPASSKPAQPPSTPGRLWVIARNAAIAGWDVTITDDDGDTDADVGYRLKLRHDAHAITIRWRLRTIDGDTQWDMVSHHRGSAGCDRKCIWRLGTLNDFLTNPPEECTPYDKTTVEYERDRLRDGVDAVLDLADESANGSVYHPSEIAARIRKAFASVSSRAAAAYDKARQASKADA